MVDVRFKRLHPSAQLPHQATPGAAGFDLYAVLDAPLTLAPLQRLKVPTGLAMAIPRGYEGQVRPRSGLAAKAGLTVLNAPGTIDSDYRGEVQVLLVNLGAEAVTLESGERVAQLVIAPVPTVNIAWADELDETARGAGGFGSTGGAKELG